jgi:type II secretory pathway pseudopilin PulG
MNEVDWLTTSRGNGLLVKAQAIPRPGALPCRINNRFRDARLAVAGCAVIPAESLHPRGQQAATGAGAVTPMTIPSESPATVARRALTPELLLAVMIIAALVVSIVAAAGAVAAVWYARRSARSSATSAAAAETTAALDSQRRHAELTPQFEIICTVGNNGVGDQGELRLALAGPTGLDRLDEVTVAILDEAGADHWARGFPTGVSEEDARRFVWGPWEFNIGASAQVTGNRTTRPRPYSRPDGKNWDRLSLVRTRPGRWMDMSPEQWQKQCEGPIRLQITCQRGGEQWILLHEVQPAT